MAKNRLTLGFEGFEETIKKLDDLNANIKKTTETALKESFEYVTQKVQSTIEPHYLTGQTEKSLRKTPVIEWKGTRVEVKVGFDIKNGGIASIFLMYGTPKMAPDRRIYNAFFGGATKRKIKELQKEIFEKEFQRLM